MTDSTVSKTETIALRPCPFCGEESPYYVCDDTGEYILCPNCLNELRSQVSIGKDMLVKDWNRRAEEERNTHVEHTVSISTGSITKEELDRYLWERSTDILPYIIPCDDTPEMSFDEALDRKIREAVKKCLEEYYREKEEEK